MSTHIDDSGPVTRRKFIYIATTAFTAVGAAAALWPAIDQMNPDASAMPERLDVDLSRVGVGQAITVRWRNMPIFIRHRMDDEIQKAKMTPLQNLRDSDARLMGAATPLPASDENRTKPGKENWLLAVGICTHESCLLSGQKPGDFKGPYDGWFCPCCASAYDTAGRVRSGPAPRNMGVPPYRFTAETKITIG